MTAEMIYASCCLSREQNCTACKALGPGVRKPHQKCYSGSQHHLSHKTQDLNNCDTYKVDFEIRFQKNIVEDDVVHGMFRLGKKLSGLDEEVSGECWQAAELPVHGTAHHTHQPEPWHAQPAVPEGK